MIMITLKNVFTVVFATCASALFANDITAGFDLKTADVINGKTYNSGAVVQPWFEVSNLKFHDVELRGLKAGIWSNIDLESNSCTVGARTGTASEIDFWVAYELPEFYKDLALEFYLKEHLYPNGGEYDRLFGLKAGYTIGSLMLYGDAAWYVDGTCENMGELVLGAKYVLGLDDVEEGLKLVLGAEAYYVNACNSGSGCSVCCVDCGVDGGCGKCQGFATYNAGATLKYFDWYLGWRYWGRLDDCLVGKGCGGWDVKNVFTLGYATRF